MFLGNSLCFALRNESRSSANNFHGVTKQTHRAASGGFETIYSGKIQMLFGDFALRNPCLYLSYSVKQLVLAIPAI